MAKEDFCFTYYDGDAARDKAHMTRLERGGYDDIISAQRKFGHLTIDVIKRVLGSDFISCWTNIELVMRQDEDGKYFIEWVDRSLQIMRAGSKKQKDKITQYWADVKSGKIQRKQKTNTTEIPQNKKTDTVDIPLENDNGDENIHFEKVGTEGKTFSEKEVDVDLILEKVMLDTPYREACEIAGYPPGKLERWMNAFNRFLKFKGVHKSREDLWRLGFPGWMNYHNYRNGEDPDAYNPVIWARKKQEDINKIFENGTHKQSVKAVNRKDIGAHQLIEILRAESQS